MIREAFKLSHNVQAGPHAQVGPEIVLVPTTDLEGVSWREAKKQLRNWYLGQAAGLRSITQKQYFGEQE